VVVAPPIDIDHMHEAEAMLIRTRQQGGAFDCEFGAGRKIGCCQYAGHRGPLTKPLPPVLY
ncbi:MAG: hypothetical protein ACPGJE_07600, partial [Wenzhouxiangellaceae bacterium]